MPVLLASKFHHLEIIAVDLIGTDVNVRIIVVYRPPGSDLAAQSAMLDLLSCLRSLTDINYPVVIAGDTNLPNIDWDSISGPNEKIYEPFIEFFFIYLFIFLKFF